VAEEVLRHPLVSDSLFVGRRWLERLPVPRAWKRATTIRPAELVTTLEAVVAQEKAKAAGAGAAAAPSWVAIVDGLLKRGRTQLEDALRSPATGEQLPTAVTDEISKISNRAVEAIAARVAPGVAAGQAQVESFLSRFDSAMDRAAQRFRTEARVVAVAASFLLAFSVGLDVIELYGRFLGDPIVRAAIVATSGVTLDRAAKRLASEGEATPSQLRAAAAAVAGGGAVPPDGADSQPALEAWLVSLTEENAPLAGRDAAWIHARLAGELTRAQALALGSELEGLRSGSTLGGVAPRGWSGWRGESGRERALHVFGVLVGALLLSLGAPFWFNALKTLVALRPLLATKEQQEAEGRRGKA
jgi:hypothetical protein